MLAIPVAVSGQDRGVTQYQIESWARPHGLPGNSVTAIGQSADGYLWIATEDGLARFDGVRFTSFTKRNSDEMRSHDVAALHVARDGTVWAGTNGAGLLRFDGRTPRWIESGAGSASDAIFALHDDGRGTLWIGTAQGLRRLPSAGGDSTVSLAGSFVRVLAPASGGGVWVGTERRGLHHASNGITTPVHGAERLGRESIRAILDEGERGMWIGTDNGLFHLANGVLQPFPHSRGLHGTDIRALLRDREGALWIGTAGAGLHRWRGGARIESLTKAHGLPGDVISTLFQDREGNIWAGTSGSGMAVLRRGAFIPFTPVEGMSHEIALPILETADGAIWAGTYGGGLNRLENGRITAFGAREGLASAFVLSLMESRDRTLWIGTRNGVFVRDARGIRRHRPGADSITAPVLAMLADRDGAVWIGTSNGLWRLRGQDVEAMHRRPGLATPFIYSLHQDRRGDVWVSTNGAGLFRFDGDRFHALTTASGLPSDVVFTVHEQSDGTIWAATSAGLSRLRNGRFSTVGLRHGLPDDKIYRILEDASGFLWMSGNHSVFRVAAARLHDVADGRAQSVESLVFSERDGLPSAEINGGFQPAGWKDRRGRLWFPTMNGVASIDPAALTTAPRPVPPLIETVDANDRSLSPDTATLELGAGTRRLAVSFTTPTFVQPHAARFEYRLDGYDESWVRAGSERTAVYTNLAPGAYTFRVRAAGGTGVWSEGRPLRLVVAPTLTQRASVKVALLLLAGLLIVAVDRWRVALHRARERQLLALVTERERAERRYRELFDGAADIVLTADASGRLTSLNRHGMATLGVDPAAAPPPTLEQVLAPASRELGASWLTSRDAPVIPGTHEVGLLRGDGSVMFGEATIQVIREGGHPVGIQAIVRDLSERRQLEAQLREANKLQAVGRLAGGIAHDFNNLLGVIKTTVSILLEDLPSSASQHRHDVAEIDKATDQAAALTRQLLAFSRKQVLDPRPLDLNLLVRDTETMLRRMIRENVQLATELDPALATVTADPGQVHQVLMNLVVNARDAMPLGGRITIRTSNRTIREIDGRSECTELNPGDYVSIDVCDTGVGMDERTRQQIFEPFFTTKEVGKGTGLGLATVYGIVKQSGGHVWVESEPGAGAIFHVVLPATTRLPERVSVAEPTRASGGGETILLVEDDDALRRLFERILRRDGYEVLVAANGIEAIGMLESGTHPVDLIVTDVIMPGLSGVEVARVARSRFPLIRIMYTSGYAGDDLSAHGVKEHASMFLPKPASPDDIRAAVRRSLDDAERPRWPAHVIAN